ncbi:MAG: hypothetical protein K0R59_1627 [Sphingobacterium sp.]|jgi:hypothetical protein|nr:hypothetical protein [Sphingobacterium sp.]
MIQNFIRLLLGTLSLAFLLVSCKKDKLEALEARPQYVLPQGNHDYDIRIVDFYKKYNTYILYKFTDADFRWNYTDLIYFRGVPADEKFVAQSMDFLDKELFSYYDEKILQSWMPYKIMLCSDIRQLFDDEGSRTPIDSVVDVAWSLSHFAFGGVAAKWNGYTRAQKLEAKGRLHGVFWASAASRHAVDLPPDFIRGIDYVGISHSEVKSLGLFVFSRSPYNDLSEYVTRITKHTKAELETLYFNPEFDPTGIYRIKYEALIAFYKTNYGIDLQAIGESGLH